jgi:hypothetical protein
VKLFQIEEPDGSPVNADMPGAAIGIDAGGRDAAVAVAVGGNPAALADREGWPIDLAVPAPSAPEESWRYLFEGARLRAERALARPVSHAVLVLPAVPEGGLSERVQAAAGAAGIALLRIVPAAEIAGGDNRAFAAAILAEDLMPRSGMP